jgi:hypothetical protein
MNGTIGWSGTASLPLAIVIFCPCAGTLSLRAVDIKELRDDGRGDFVGAES